jgi:hypothetical protein
VTMTSTRQCGTRAKYVVERCRCAECREAVRLYERKRTRAIRRPDEVWVPYVPAGKARRHLKELAEYGIGLKTVAKVSGVPHGALSKLIYGDPARRRGPSKRIRPETERRILSVSLEDAAGAAKVPAGPTWRLLDDLIARGFTRTWIAGQLGADSPSLQISRVRVRATTARKVAELHRRLEGVEAPPRRSRWSS